MIKHQSLSTALILILTVLPSLTRADSMVKEEDKTNLSLMTPPPSHLQNDTGINQNPEPNFDQDPEPVPVHTMTENPDVEKQMQGQYPVMDRPESQPLGAIQHAWDKAPPHAGTYQAIFSPHQVIRVRAREYMTSSLIFPQWEVIDEIIVGDESAYQVTKIKPYIVVVRPKEFIGLDSTITVIGRSGRIYSFYIRTEGYNSKNIADVAIYIKAPKTGNRLKSSLPLDTDNAPSSKQQDSLDDVYHDPGSINFNFNMAGDAEIAPLRVYSDGIRTWFDYGNRLAKTNLPTIYRVEDGVDTPINVSREGNKLIAQTAGKFTLRNGGKVVCVWPEKSKS